LVFASDDNKDIEDGLPIFGKVGIIKLFSFLLSFFKGIISSVNSSLIVIFGVEV